MGGKGDAAAPAQPAAAKADASKRQETPAAAGVAAGAAGSEPVAAGAADVVATAAEGGVVQRFTAVEVAEHCETYDCWLIIENKVYDVTKFIPDHPGGNIIFAQAGYNVTKEFNGAHHAKNRALVLDKLAEFYVGDFDPSMGDGVKIIPNIVSRAFWGFEHLFFNRKFLTHRVMGLAYLIQFSICCHLWLWNYPKFLESPVIITLPITGALQALSAILTFTFLPKKQVDGGYFSYKPGNKQGTLSYAFIKENFFFASILGLQWLYYNDKLYPLFQALPPLEYCFVFLPYVFRSLFPDLFPKTSFRDSLRNMEKDGSPEVQEGQQFYWWVTWITKMFYIWAKHFLGFFLNYFRFINGASYYEIYCVYLIEITAAFATTIAIFLHTLRFKGYLDPRVSLAAYVIAYLSTFIGYIMIAPVFWKHPQLSLITAAGVVINVVNVQAFDAYQIMVMGYFHYTYRMPKLE